MDSGQTAYRNLHMVHLLPVVSGYAEFDSFSFYSNNVIMKEHVPEDIPKTSTPENAGNDLAEDALLEAIGELKQRHVELLELLASVGDAESIRGLARRIGRHRNTVRDQAAILKQRGFVDTVKQDHKSDVHVVVTDIGRRVLQILRGRPELVHDAYGTRATSLEGTKQAAQKAGLVLRDLKIPTELEYVAEELRHRLLPTALDAFAGNQSEEVVLSLLERRLMAWVELIRSRNGVPRPSCAQLFGLNTSEEPPVDGQFYSREVAHEESDVSPYYSEHSGPEREDDDEILDRDEQGKPVYREGCSPEERQAADLQAKQSDSVDDQAEGPEEAGIGPKISAGLAALRVGQFQKPERIQRDGTLRAQAQELYDSARLAGEAHQGALSIVRGYLEIHY